MVTKDDQPSSIIICMQQYLCAGKVYEYFHTYTICKDKCIYIIYYFFYWYYSFEYL